MARQIFVNLTAKNLPKLKEFFIKLGFEFNPQFTNDEGACMGGCTVVAFRTRMDICGK